MNKENVLLICYIIIFTVFNLAVFLMYYLFGFTYDRDLRKTEKRMVLPPISRFFFFFRGIQSSSRSRPTKLCGTCELFAFAYLIGMEIINVIIALIFNDLVLSCRVSVVCFALLLAVIIIFTIRAKKKIKAAALEEHKRNVEKYLTPKETIDINNDSVVDEFLSEPHEKPDGNFNPLNLFDEKSLAEEATDVSEGREAFSEMKKSITAENSVENAIAEEILSAQRNPNDADRETADVSEGMEAFSEMKKSIIAENAVDDAVAEGILSAPLNADDTDRETADLNEGMKMLEKMRNNPIEDEPPIPLP